MADISKIQIENTSYDIKDVTAREMTINPLSNRKFVLISDSYGEGYTTGGYITSWFNYFKTLNGLDNTNCVTNCLGGAGFGGTLTTKDFYDLVNELTSDDDVTDVVICGGYNDMNFTWQNIVSGINQVNNLVKTKFPNAQLHIGMIGGTSLSSSKYGLYFVAQAYTQGCATYNIHYLSNVEYVLKDIFNLLTSDGIHPNASGQQMLAYYITRALIDGYCDVIYSYVDVVYTLASVWDQIRNRSLGCMLNNSSAILMKGAKTILNSTNGNSLQCDGEHSIEIGTITNGYINGNSNGYTIIPTQFLILDDTTFKYAQGYLKIVNNIIYAYPQIVENNAYTTALIKELQILPYYAKFDSLFC